LKLLSGVAILTLYRLVNVYRDFEGEWCLRNINDYVAVGAA